MKIQMQMQMQTKIKLTMVAFSKDESQVLSQYR